LNCNASYQLGLKAPVADVPSIYAQEGSQLHDEIARVLAGTFTIDALTDRVMELTHLSSEHHDLLTQAISALTHLMTKYGGRWKIIALEQRYPFPGIPSSFGTVDLVISNGQVIIVLDWKFGGGVRVRALYDNGEISWLNAQLVYYTLCARAARKRLFRDKMIVIAVVQPRAEEPLDYTEVDNRELDDWQGHLTQAYLGALDRNPQAVRGSWCQFCVAKSICPEWTDGLHDLYDLDLPGSALRASVEQAPDKHGNFLGKALTLSRFAEQWGAEIQRQAHLYASEGGHIPGWRLVPKRANRSWGQSEHDTVKALVDIGMPEPELYSEPALLSPAQAEKALKKRKLSLPDGLAVSISNGTTLAPADDPRPSIDHIGALRELDAMLEDLK
jgi:hypothetical protein